MSTKPNAQEQNIPSNSYSRLIRTGIVGTGYIADFHALGIQNAEGVELVSVCDANLNNAKVFASNWRVPAVFDSIGSMLQNQRLDSIHLLVPPHLHYPLAKTALEAGSHVLIEKPMCVSVAEADELCKLASVNGLQLGVSHNMLYAGAYQRLRDLVHAGALGPLDYVAINHFIELGQLRLGPFDSWMLRSPENVFLEIGPHLISALIDLVGVPSDIVATADRRISLPNGAHAYARWRVRATVGRTAVDININLSPGFPQRTIVVHGLLGSATVDYDANTCSIDHRTSLGIDFDRYKRSRTLARQIHSQARRTLSDYILSKLKLRRRGNPYQVTFIDSVPAFYSAIRSKIPIDSRTSGNSGRDVVKCCMDVIEASGVERAIIPGQPKRIKPAVRPTVLVIGGTGFIGRELIRQLLDANYYVRAAVRGSGIMLEEFDSSHLEIVRADLHSESDLKVLMDGIEFVYHLALANVKTWEDHVRNNVEPTRLIGEACLAAGIKRFIFTGTIDSYYAGAKAGTITEQTPLDPNIKRRNNYARAKAEAENILMEMCRKTKLPLVVFRPGIVIGKGGNPFHFGVGTWASEAVCEVWGDGNNKLPFVLVSDVASALVRGIQVAGIEGRSYNLVDDPILTARDYINELQQRSGVIVKAHYCPIWRFYLVDTVKWLVKLAVGHPDRIRIPSYFDWESRTQRAYFENKRARDELGWRPASNRKQLIDDGIGGSLHSWLAVGIENLP